MNSDLNRPARRLLMVAAIAAAGNPWRPFVHDTTPPPEPWEPGQPLPRCRGCDAPGVWEAQRCPACVERIARAEAKRARRAAR